MAAKYVRRTKTFIEIDSEWNVAGIKTQVEAVAAQLTRLGFEEFPEIHAPFRSFMGQASQIYFGSPKEEQA